MCGTSPIVYNSEFILVEYIKGQQFCHWLRLVKLQHKETKGLFLLPVEDLVAGENVNLAETYFLSRRLSFYESIG